MPDASPSAWPAWQRAAFRFLALYLPLQVAPWRWLAALPGAGGLVDAVDGAIDAAVRAANAHVFHVRAVLVPVNGSGDTSWAWAHLLLAASVALAGSVAWSGLARRRAYPHAAYWGRTLVRGYVASHALSYGLIKVFPAQMPFPTPSQLATPLGDFLPMRLQWVTVGYAGPYQSFAGATELLAGLLLLYRPTTTLGALAATGAFANVAMLNLAYDIPVKLFSLHLLACSVLLLACDAPRLAALFLRNRAVGPSTLFDPPVDSARARRARAVAKAVLAVLWLALPAWQARAYHDRLVHPAPAHPLAAGLHDVRTFVRNGDTLPPLAGDPRRWRDVAIDGAASGSVGATDARFWMRYGRGYFRYAADTARRTLVAWRTSFRQDSVPLFTARYAPLPGGATRLSFRFAGDTLDVELVPSARRFALETRPFHWLSEYNR